MRKIQAGQIALFLTFFFIAFFLGIYTTKYLLGTIPLGDFRGVTLLFSGILFIYFYAIVIYRLFIKFMPLQAGEILPESQQEFIYHVYILFYLILFYPILRSSFLPTPLNRLFYLALGTRLGTNTYTQGIIHDPPFIEIGDNCVIGQSALLVPHVIEGNKLAHYPIKLGDNVTIGANSVILSDVTLGDYAIVATGAVVKKGTRIKTGEVWGGVPARYIKTISPSR